MTVPTQPCPATKRNGEICNSTRISQSGFCFAHDPESLEWRRMGGYAKSEQHGKPRVRPIKDPRLDSMANSLQEILAELGSQPPTPNSARAMARIVDSIARIIYRTAPSSDEEVTPLTPPSWVDY